VAIAGHVTIYGYGEASLDRQEIRLLIGRLEMFEAPGIASRGYQLGARCEYGL
jgi:hypothetical protein